MTRCPRLTPRKSLIAAGATLLALGGAGSAHAATQTFGSSLQAPASVADAHQADTASWQPSLMSPASGQIKAIRLKGKANLDPGGRGPGGETMWHLQALKRQVDGTFLITRTSQPFFVPGTGDAQQVSTYSPTDFCISAGEFLAFNTVGGWDGIRDQTGPYPMGTPLQIFARAPGQVVSQFEGADKTNNGDVMRPNSMREAELLMQAVVGTDVDAVTHCPGGRIASDGSVAPVGGFGGGAGAGPGTPTAAQRLTIPSKQRIRMTRKGSISVAVFCQPGLGRCQGKLTVLSTGSSRRKSFGARSFSVGPKSNGKVKLTLGKAGRAAFKKKKSKLPVLIQAVSAPGGADRTSTFSTTLRRRGA